MKKVLALALGMLLIPFTAFGMETLSDADMDSVTGQSGVAITVDDILLYQGDSETWYQTQDAETDNYAAIGLVDLSNSGGLTFINAIIANDPTAPGDNYAVGVAFTGNYGGYMDYQQMYNAYAEVESADYNHADHISALTITVREELPIFSAALSPLGGGVVAGVKIGLPTVEVYSQGGATEIYTSVNDMTSAEDHERDPANGTQFRYGTIWSGSDGMAVLGGDVEIAPLEAYLDAKP